MSVRKLKNMTLIRSIFEGRVIVVEDGRKRSESSSSTQGKAKSPQKSKAGVRAFLLESRFSGLPLALLYGAFIYYYVTFLVLSEAPSREGIRPTEGDNSTYNKYTPG